ncbi:MAG: shikimate kinase [Desulfobacteraceae bacterium]|nr:shikimate kinase [Desulfobacteraceae bacterium]
MKERNIALIGFRATGKTTVGKILARNLGRIFMDMDQHLVASSGREISCWVKLAGWSSFRRAESELLAALSLREGLVVATGGGIVLDPANRTLLDESFYTVWLKASPETIQARMSSDPQTGSTRPPLSELSPETEIRKTLAERYPLYAASADMEIDTECKTAEDIAGEILEKMSG